MLFSLGGSFLYYADRFKLYSAFCASHTKVPKVLVKGRSCVLDRQTRERDVPMMHWSGLSQMSVWGMKCGYCTPDHSKICDGELGTRVYGCSLWVLTVIGESACLAWQAYIELSAIDVCGPPLMWSYPSSSLQEAVNLTCSFSSTSPTHQIPPQSYRE